MKYYQLIRTYQENDTLLDQITHDLIDFFSGCKLPDAFKGPLVVELDEDFINGKMKTLYTDPALIVHKSFYKKLKNLNINNIQVFPVVIEDNVNDKNIENYVLLNIIGLVSCAVNTSEYYHIGPGMTIIDDLIIDKTKVNPEYDIFLVAEDTDCIVVSERVYLALVVEDYDDILFKKLS